MKKNKKNADEITQESNDGGEVGRAVSDIPEDSRNAALSLRDDLTVSRAIAMDVFGAKWRGHLAEVYDRFVVERGRQKKANGPRDTHHA